MANRARYPVPRPVVDPGISRPRAYYVETQFDQLDYAYWEDGASILSTATATAINTAFAFAFDTIFVIGFSIDGFGSVLPFDQGLQLQYRNVTQATGWNNVNATSSHIRSANATPADGGAIGSDGTPPANAIYTGSKADAAFITGLYDEVDGEIEAANDLGGTNWAEYRFGITIRSAEANSGDQIECRLIYGSASERHANLPLNFYTRVLQLTAGLRKAGRLSLLGAGH